MLGGRGDDSLLWEKSCGMRVLKAEMGSVLPDVLMNEGLFLSIKADCDLCSV